MGMIESLDVLTVRIILQKCKHAFENKEKNSSTKKSFTEMLQTAGFQTLLSYPDNFRFDLVITDMTSTNCLLGFVHKFNYPPLMAVSPFGHPPHLNAFVGGHHYYSYSPHYILPYTQKMNFFQRFTNFLVLVYELL